MFKWFILTSFSVMIVIVYILFQHDEIDEPTGVPNGNSATYDLHFKMNKDGLFTAESNIEVINLSENDWEHLQFYFIPNMFTEENRPPIIGDTAEVHIHSITVNGRDTSFHLQNDLLQIPLHNKLKPNDTVDVKIDYQFTVPTNSLRFNRVGDNFYLAQSYPMLATYQQNNWNQVTYSPDYESYHTDFSDFTISYELPKGYSLISTSDQDLPLTNNKGSVQVKNVKEVYLAIIKNMEVEVKHVDEVEVRAFGSEDRKGSLQKAVEIGADALNYFNKNVSKYPFGQLDIVVDEDIALGMEYPGIVQVNEAAENWDFENTVVHEVAHQWFYGIVSNDPYSDAWIDEGLTEFATMLFWIETLDIPSDEIPNVLNTRLQAAKDRGFAPQPSNLPASDYETAAYVYGQPGVKLWELFDENGGVKEANKFLRAYVKSFAYEQVNTELFIEFTKDYFKMDNDDFFASWLKLEQ